MSIAETPDSLQISLQQGLAALGISLSPDQTRKLIRYLQLLQKWNATYNLTAIRDCGQMVTHHLLDSLAVLPHLSGRRLLDVGTGAGLPGIPLAIAVPELQVTMVDSNSKKTAFVQQAISELELRNASVICARAEKMPLDGPPYEMIITRAYSDIAGTLAQVRHLLAPSGRLLAMKGQRPDAELAGLPAPFVALHVVPLQVPSLDAARHLVIIGTEDSI